VLKTGTGTVLIEKAVIPAAGLGSRMLPITKSIPKEMLPAGRKPMIQLAVEEAVASGVRRVCIVIREGKEIIRDYFCARQPKERKRDASIDELEKLGEECELSFVYQHRPLGLGDALLQAREFVAGEPFVLMMPDQFMRSSVPATLQLTRRWTASSSQPHVLSSLMRVAKDELPFFAGARGVEIESALGADEFVLGRLQTEEETRAAYRDHTHELRGFGRTIYPPEIFDYLGEDYVNPATGEIDLWRTFEASAGRIAHRGIVVEGAPVDMGTFEGYYHYLPRFRETGA
jgi:UTP--glucose-1-phosphate uridylyltransferase